MNLLPLRKEVESLNKDIQSQNIQIKDLIQFLKKSTPNNATCKYQSPRSNLKKILQLKDSYSQDQRAQRTDDKKVQAKEFRQSKSMKYLRPFQPIKSIHEVGSKHLTSRQLAMTKSVTFHNMKNAMTTRKYLKLSQPQKKINSSCSLCRETTFGSNNISQCSKLQKLPSRTELPSKIIKSKQMDQKVQKGIKKSVEQQSKQKLKQKVHVEKRMPLKELGSNQVLSKETVKGILERKSSMKAGKQQAKSKGKLLLKDDKQNRNGNGLKK